MRVHLNAAVSLEGAMAGPDGQSLRLSSPEDWRRVHRLRAASDAILVGAGTVRRDDPRLLVDPRRAGRSATPLRVVLDPRLTTPTDARVLRGAAPTLLLASRDAVRRRGHRYACDVAAVRATAAGLSLDRALDVLADHGVAKVLVEGGARVHRSFLTRNLANVCTVYVAPRSVGSDKAPRFPAELLPRAPKREEALGGGLLRTYRWRR